METAPFISRFFSTPAMMSLLSFKKTIEMKKERIFSSHLPSLRAGNLGAHSRIISCFGPKKLNPFREKKDSFTQIRFPLMKNRIIAYLM
jgi:hypothetical protein